MISKQEFAEAYAQRSGVTAKWLKEHGREARSCDCEEGGCEGWQMAHIKDILGDKLWAHYYNATTLDGGIPDDSTCEKCVEIKRKLDEFI